MNRLLTIVICLSLSGCIGASVSNSSAPRRQLTRSQIIQLAKQELAHRKLPLPADYTVTVDDSSAIPEFDAPREIYAVLFTFTYRGKRQVIYTVHIDKKSGEIDVSDYRTTVPLRRSAARS